MAENRPLHEVYPNGPVRTVELDFPITKAHPPITRVDFWRRFTVQDLIDMDELALTGMLKEVDMMRRVTLMATEDLKRLDAWDWSVCDDVLSDFLTSGRPKTTENSKSP